MERKEKIETLYFNEKKTQTEIAKLLGMSINCVSKALRKNENYNVEKELRKQANHKKRRELQKQMIYGNRNSLDADYQALQRQLDSDIKLFSKNKRLSNLALRKWCSAYNWNSEKKAFQFDKAITKSNDLPNIIKI